MSINNIILKPNYTQYLSSNTLPFEISSDGLERLVFSSATSRQSLSINSDKLHILAKDGHIYLTTKRFIYITASQGDIETFLIDLNLAPVLQFSHELKSPWFGANYWQFMFFSASEPSIASDGFPKQEYFKGQVMFNEGGIFEFIECMNRALNDVVNNKEVDEELPQYSAVYEN